MGPADRQTEPRALFADLVSRAAGEATPRPSAGALDYLVELLIARLRVPAPSDPQHGQATLAEALLRARLLQGRHRVSRLRAVGDRALFVSGFFGDSLARSLVDLDYYREIGRLAYADLSSWLSARAKDPTWPGLFGELAERFADLTDVLAEVGDHSRASGARDLLRLYERYLRTGSRRDLRRLIRIGGVVPSLGRGIRWQ